MNRALKWRIYDEETLLKEEESLMAAFQSARELISQLQKPFLRLKVYVKCNGIMEEEIIKVHNNLQTK